MIISMTFRKKKSNFTSNRFGMIQQRQIAAIQRALLSVNRYNYKKQFQNEKAFLIRKYSSVSKLLIDQQLIVRKLMVTITMKHCKQCCTSDLGKAPYFIRSDRQAVYWLPIFPPSLSKFRLGQLRSATLIVNNSYILCKTANIYFYCQRQIKKENNPQT